MLKADITFKQVDGNGWCCSGHQPPSNFKIDGIDQPTRYFLISGQGIEGIYCELCLTIANYMSKCKKKGLL